MSTRCEDVAQRTLAALDDLRGVSDLELADRAGRLKESGGPTDDAVTATALCLVAEACRRTVGADVDEGLVYAGAAMSLGMAAELPRDARIEVALLFPVFVRSLEQKGVHVCDLDQASVTSAADVAAAALGALNVRVAVVSEEQDANDKRQAYRADVTFGLLSTFVLDHLRDGLARHVPDRTQRDLHGMVVADLDVLAVLGARNAHSLGAAWQEAPPQPPPTLMKLVERMRVGKRHEVLIDEQGIRLTARGMRAADKAIGRRTLLDPTDPLCLAKLLSALAVRHDARDSLERPLISVHHAGFLSMYRTMVGVVAYPAEAASVLRKRYRLEVATAATSTPVGTLPRVPTTIYPTGRDLHAALDRLRIEREGRGGRLVVADASAASVALRSTVRARTRSLGEGPAPADVVSVGYGRTAINRAIRNDLLADQGRVLLAADAEPCTRIRNRKLLGSARGELTFDAVDSTEPAVAVAAAQEEIERDAAALQARGLALDNFVDTHRRLFAELRRSAFGAQGAERFMATAAQKASREQEYRKRCDELGTAIADELRRQVILIVIDDARYLYLYELDAVMNHFEFLVEGEGVAWYGEVAAAAYDRAMRYVSGNSLEHFLSAPVNLDAGR